MYKEITIIGAGPAGIAAAIQLKREGFEPFLLEQHKVGGLLWNANLIENYPGFPDGIPGKKLAWLFSEQLKKLNIKVSRQRVKHLAWKKGFFEIETEVRKSGKNRFASRMVIVASGTIPKKISLPDGKGSFRRRFFYEINELTSTERKKITIIGGGDVAFDYALNLVSPEVICQSGKKKRNCRVDLVFRDSSPKCLPILLVRAKRSKKIKLWPDTVPLRIREGEGKIFLDCKSNPRNSLAGPEKEFSLSSDYILVAIGRVLNIDFLSEELQRFYLEKDYEKEPLFQKGKGIFFVGDVVNGDYRQAGIAVGEGLACGMRIARFLKKEKFNLQE